MSFPNSDLDAISSAAGDETLRFTRSEQTKIKKAPSIVREKRAKKRAENREKSRKKAEKAEALKKERRIRGTRPFRFLDLPVELRNETMDYAMGDEERLPLSRPILPPLTRVSKQVRAKALGVFFSENSFWVTVYSNFHARQRDREYKASHRPGAAPPIPVKSRATKSGLMGIKRKVRNPLKNALFRQVEIQIVDAITGHTRDMIDGRPQYVVAYLSLGWEHGAARVSWRQGNRHPNHHFGPPRTRADAEYIAREAHNVDMTIQEAIRIANDVAAQHKDFKGFTLKDLETVAKTFRFTSS